MRHVSLAAAALAATMGVTAMAAPEAADSLARQFKLDEVVVTSTRLGTQAGLTNTKVDNRTLQQQNSGQNLPYLLQRTPSLVVTSDDGLGVGYADFRIRGTASTRVNMTINGVPLNDSESQGVFWVNMTDMAASMNSVDIQRGVGTSTNGSAAFGASVNMSMGEVNPNPYAAITFNGGSYNTFRESVKAGTGLLKHGFAVDARYSKVNSDGYVEHAVSDLHSYFVSGSWYGERTMLKLLVFGGAEHTGIAWDGIDPITWRDAPRTNYSGYYKDADGVRKYWDNHADNYRQRHYQLHFSHVFDNRWSLSAALHHTHGDGYTEQAKNGTLTEYGLHNYMAADSSMVEKSYLIRRKHLLNDFTGAVVSGNYRTDRLRASAGGAVSYYDGQHFGHIIKMIDPDYPEAIDPDWNYYKSYADKLDANVYAKAEWLPVEGLTLYGDVQYRYINYHIKGVLDDGPLTYMDATHDFHFINPKTGVNYKWKGQQAYLTFAVSNREPVRSNYTDAGPNAAPTSERLYDFELGYRIDRRVFFAAANLYLMKYDNQLVLSGRLSDTGEALTVNVDNSYRAGIELSAGVHISPNLQWQANLTLSRNRILDYTDWADIYVYNEAKKKYKWNRQEAFNYGDVDIAMSPNVTAASIVTYTKGRFTAELQTNYVGRQYLDNTSNEQARLDDYVVSNLHMSYTIPFRRSRVRSVELSLMLNNLFNEKYVSNGWVYCYYTGTDTSVESRQIYDNDNIGYYAQAPFNVHGGVTVNF